MSDSSVPTVFAPHLDDEVLLNYVWRTAMTNGRLDTRGVAAACFNVTAINIPWVLPSGLARFAEVSSPTFQDADDVIERATLLPAFLPFLTAVERQAVLAFARGEWKGRGSPVALLGLASQDVKTRPMMAQCRACVLADISAYGFAYWHRAHMLPGLAVCPLHDRPLEIGCGRCQGSRRLSRVCRLPAITCSCGEQLREVFPTSAASVGTAAEVRVGQLWSCLLRGELARVGPWDIGVEYRKRAAEMGFFNRARLRADTLRRAFQSSYSQELLFRLNAALDGESNWLETSLRKGRAPRKIGRNLLMLDFLFGGVPSKLRAEVSGALSSREKAASEPQATSTLTEDVLYVRRLSCAKSLPSSPEPPSGCTTIQVQSRPTPRNRPVSRDRTKERSLLRDDEQAANHIRRRHAELSASDARPMRMTRQLLLEGLRRANEISGARLQAMPRTKAALSECCESPSVFRRRAAMWVLRNEYLWSSSGLKEAVRRTGISPFEADRLVMEALLKKIQSEETDASGRTAKGSV